MGSSALDCEALFDATPTPYLVLTPDLVIVGLNRAREHVTGVRREDVLGRDLFEAFPDDPTDVTATGVRNLRASLARVLATKQPDTMPVQKYSLPAADGSSWTERWWSPVNVPVLGDDGEVVLLLHRVTEVTEWVQVRAQRQQELDAALHEADSDLFARAQELHAARLKADQDVEHIRGALLTQRVIGEAVGLLMARLGLDHERAFSLLVQESQYRNTKLRQIADEHVQRHSGQLRDAARPRGG